MHSLYRHASILKRMPLRQLMVMGVFMHLDHHNLPSGVMKIGMQV